MKIFKEFLNNNKWFLVNSKSYMNPHTIKDYWHYVTYFPVAWYKFMGSTYER